MKKKWKPMLAYLLVSALLLNTSCFTAAANGIPDAEAINASAEAPVSVNQHDTANAPNTGSALQTGTKASTKGFFSRTHSGTEINSDDYFYNFDYYVPSDSVMKNYYVWSCYDLERYVLPTLIQNENTLAVACNNKNYVVTANLERDTWHTITLHYFGSQFALYLDGKLVKLGDDTYITRSDTAKVQNIGYCGDISDTAGGPSGYALYDNFKLVSGGAVLKNFNFDSGMPSDFNVYGNGISQPCLNQEKNHPAAVLSSIAVTQKRTEFSVGSTAKIGDIADVDGLMSDGTSAILKMGSIQVTSGNPDIVEVQNNGGQAVINCKKAGSCTLQISETLFGVTQSANISVNVANSVFADKIGLTEPAYGEKILLVPGGTVPLSFLKYNNDGTRLPVALKDIEAAPGYSEFTVSSSDNAVVRVDKTDSQYTVTGLGTGSADIIIRYTANGRTMETKNPVECLNLKSVDIAILKQPVYVTDQHELKATGTLTDGSAVDLNKLHMADYSVDPADCAHVTNGKQAADAGSCKMLVADKAAETAKVTLSVRQSTGETFSSSANVTIKNIVPGKTKSTYYTAQKVEAARENISAYAWAKQTRDGAVTKADQYLKMGYEQLWTSITSENIPRSYAVNQSCGCLNCGGAINKFGNYPYQFSSNSMDWKLECPNCHTKFPTNDFKAYYEGGLNKYGEFDPQQAKQHNNELIAAGGKGNLVNLSDDHTDDPAWGVDDGMGYVDPKANQRYTFVAYYNHWVAWYNGPVKNAMDSFSQAYLYTGEQKYADAAIVILDRIADLYPDMDITPYKYTDGYLNSNGNSGRGKVVGSIWETNLADAVMKAYDAVFPAIDSMGQQAKDFLAAKSITDDKTNPNRIKVNFEDGVLRQVYSAFKKGQIQGNNGMHQETLALAAVILDSYPETQEWLNFDFKSGLSTGANVTGGNISTTFVNDISQDGQGNESSPFYNSLWLTSWIQVANMLADYQLPNGTPLDAGIEYNLYKNAKFKKMFYAMYPLLLSDNYTPAIGDSNQTGKPDTSFVDKDQLLKAYSIYKDPELAKVIYLMNGSKSDGLKLDIFTKNPRAIAGEIQTVINEQGEYKEKSQNLSGFCLSVLRDGERKTTVIPKGLTYLFCDLTEKDRTPNTSTAYWESSDQTEQFNARAVGDTVSYEFKYTGTEGKKYDFYLGTWAASSYGHYQVSVNDEVIAQDVDFTVGSMTVYKNLGSISNLRKGVNTIRFTCVAAGAAGGFKMGVHRIVFSEPGQTPENKDSTQRAAWMYYGGQGNHDHKDALNLGLTGYNLDLLPDLGYPEFADGSRNRFEWVGSTLSHNTVVVDGTQQNNSAKRGRAAHFDDAGSVKLMDVEANNFYSSTSLYKRTTAMIRIDAESSYLIDLFHVTGGNKQEYSFHAAESDGSKTVIDGLNLTGQKDSSGNYIGSYAGRDVAYAALPSGAASFTNIGYQWLKNVDTDADGVQGKFSVDWNIKDTYNVYGKGLGALTDVHLKLTMLGNYDQVSLADGIPPTNKVGNPASLKYLLVKNQGSSLNTVFTSVIEPYKTNSNISSIREVPVTYGGSAIPSNEVKAVQVTLKSGRVDYIVCAQDTSKQYRVDDRFDFCGFFGVYSEKDGKMVSEYINGGTKIQNLTAQKEITGKVAGFTTELADSNFVDIQPEQAIADLQSLKGRYIYINNHQPLKNAIYEILDARKQDNGTVRLDIGNVSTVGSYLDNSDLGKGYRYNLAQNDSFTIPLSSSFSAEYQSPLITGVEDGKAYFNARTVTYDANGGNVLSATVNGKDFSSGSVFSSPGNYAVSVKDDSGNETTVSFSIKAVPKPEEATLQNSDAMLGTVSEIEKQLAEDSSITQEERQSLEESKNRIRAAVTTCRAAALNSQSSSESVLAAAQEYDSLGSAKGFVNPEVLAALRQLVQSKLLTDAATGISVLEQADGMPLGLTLDVRSLDADSSEYQQMKNSVAADENLRVLGSYAIRLLKDGNNYELKPGKKVKVIFPVSSAEEGKALKAAFMQSGGSIKAADVERQSGSAELTIDCLNINVLLAELSVPAPLPAEPSQPAGEDTSSPSSSEEKSSPSPNTGDTVTGGLLFAAAVSLLICGLCIKYRERILCCGNSNNSKK